MKKEYDYLIVGAGLYGAMFAYTLTKRGMKCLVVDKRNHIGGNCYTEKKHGINVHCYGPHIFRTNDKRCWEFVNTLCEFVPFTNTPMAEYEGRLFNLPFNMNTFNKLWGTATPKEAKAMIDSQRVKYENPTNIEEYALSVVGRDIYEMFIKSYTEKQWGCDCKSLPIDIIKRIPIRLTYDNNYHQEKYQGVPKDGYTKMFESLLKGSDLLLNVDYLKEKSKLPSANQVIYTGRIDEYFGCCLGELGYRSVDFHHVYLENVDDWQGVAVVNHTGPRDLFTRTVEHKHFEGSKTKGTIVTYEFPHGTEKTGIACYPLNDNENQRLYLEYKKMAIGEKDVVFGGRLAEYSYYNMNDIVEKFLDE